MKKFVLMILSSFCLMLVSSQAVGSVSIVIPSESGHVFHQPNYIVEHSRYHLPRKNIGYFTTVSSPDCYRKEYREQYVEGTASSPGYVKSYDIKVQVPCYDYYAPHSVVFDTYYPAFSDTSVVLDTYPEHSAEYGSSYDVYSEAPDVSDEEQCVTGTVLGGIAGAVFGHNAFNDDDFGRFFGGAVGAGIGNSLSCEE
jgi:hypothetical protein